MGRITWPAPAAGDVFEWIAGVADMSVVAGLLLLSGLLACLVLGGYWLAAGLRDESPAVRFAVAVLASFGGYLFMVASIGFFRPLAGVWAAWGMLPVVATLASPRARAALRADLRHLVSQGAVRLGALGFIVFLIGLLFPVIGDGEILFHDGTSNHDSFFWITSGEYLRGHTYMEAPSLNATQPWLNAAAANVGWQPPGWGRMGAEGLLALASALARTTPLPSYLYSTAALYLPWVAALFLMVRVFWVDRLSWAALGAMVLLQPLFLYFYANSNLPNLVGAIAGATVIVATEQAFRVSEPRQRRAWSILLLLGLHGLIASYPEMTPFVLLPCGLLGLRHWARVGFRVGGRSVGTLALVFVAGTVINPATGIRAWSGFMASFHSARADNGWANLFDPLVAAAHGPGLLTLSVPAMRVFGPVSGWLLSLLLMAGVVFAWRRARDPFGAAATLTGALALLVYTLATGFSYGWQKTAQFGAFAIAAMIPIAVLHVLAGEAASGGRGRRWAGSLALGIAVFFAYATLWGFRDYDRWRREKTLSLDWLELREASRGVFRDRAILIDAATFQMPFFHGMWSSYFLADSHIYFARRGEENGGYLSGDVLDEGALPAASAVGVLVGRAWAEAFDAHSPRLLAGREYVLLERANRVWRMEGVYPLNGLPEHASSRVLYEIHAHEPGKFRLSLRPRLKENWPVATWSVSHRVANGERTITMLGGPPPWQFEVPLIEHQDNLIEISVTSPTGSQEDLPFAITAMGITGVP